MFNIKDSTIIFWIHLNSFKDQAYSSFILRLLKYFRMDFSFVLEKRKSRTFYVKSTL